MQCDMVTPAGKRYAVASASRHLVLPFTNEECLLNCPTHDETAEYVAGILFPQFATDTSRGQAELVKDFHDAFATFFESQLAEAKADYDTTSATAKRTSLSQLGYRHLLLSAIVLSDPAWMSTSEDLARTAGSGGIDLDALCSGVLTAKSADDIHEDLAKWQASLLESLRGLAEEGRSGTAFREVRATLARLEELQGALASNTSFKSNDALVRQVSGVVRHRARHQPVP
jgi:hypothetical protein